MDGSNPQSCVVLSLREIVTTDALTLPTTQLSRRRVRDHGGHGLASIKHPGHPTPLPDSRSPATYRSKQSVYVGLSFSGTPSQGFRHG
jgi:hypothetical protein